MKWLQIWILSCKNYYFHLGSTVDSRDGYVGCIRGLMLNGEVVDLKSHAEKGLYGKQDISYFNIKGEHYQRSAF